MNFFQPASYGHRGLSILRSGFRTNKSDFLTRYGSTTFSYSLSAPSNRGAVLVFVLVVALGLVSVTIYFANAITLEYRAGDNSIAGMEAEQACSAGRRYALVLLNKQEEAGMLPDLETYAREAVEVNEAKFWFIGRSSGLSADTSQPTYGLVDEASKLNLNTATRAMLEALPNMTAELAAAIIDWRDANEEPETDGAEAPAYALLDPSYSPKNTSFESVDELRWIRDMTPDILYGEDTNRNGILDPNEDDGDEMLPTDNQDGVLNPGLAEYVTVWSREPNTREDGTKKANIASSESREALRNLLNTALGQSRAQQIIQATGTQPLRSPLEFFLRSGMSKEEFEQVGNDLCITNDAYTTGLINVNTAPEAVLTCLPGIGPDHAAEVISYRQERSVEELKSIAWISDVLDRANAIQAGPHITTRSYQISADIVAIGHRGKGMYRSLSIVDISDGEARILYHRDLGRIGWPLGQADLHSTNDISSF